MKLTPRERAVIAATEMNCERTSKEIGVELGVKEHTVVYTLRSLRERGIIVKRAHINGLQLGLRDVGLYFSLIDLSETARQTLFKRFIAHKSVTYLGSVLGEYSYLAVIRYKDLFQIKTTVHEIFGGTKEVFANKQLVPRIMGTRFARKFLHPGIRQSDEVVFEHRDNPVVLDETDKQLLHLLANTGFESLRDVGRRIGLAPATLDGRLKRLRAANVIKAFYYHLSDTALSVQAYRILLTLRSVSLATPKPLLEYCQRHPNIIYLIGTLGAWDYEIGIEMEDSGAMPKITEEIWSLLGRELSGVVVMTEVEDLKVAPFSIG
jgi:DNA-binding Lrp family transcriptional regulator